MAARLMTSSTSSTASLVSDPIYVHVYIHSVQCVQCIVGTVYNMYSHCVIISPRRACAAKATILGLCVYDYSCTTGYEAAYERYQQLQCYKGILTKCGDFAETAAFKRYGVKTSEKANMHNQLCLSLTRFGSFSAP